jgi:HCNGP-like protein
MNGTRIIPRPVTVEDDPEPGDPPPRPSTPAQYAPEDSMDVESAAPSPPSVIELGSPSDEQPEYMSARSYTSAQIRQATMPNLPPDLDDFGIPPSPPGTPDVALAEKLRNFQQLRERGVFFNDRLVENKGFRNPKLLDKLAGYVGIQDEYGSNLPTEVWNPRGFSKDQYYDKLGISPLLNI